MSESNKDLPKSGSDSVNESDSNKNMPGGTGDTSKTMTEAATDSNEDLSKRGSDSLNQDGSDKNMQGGTSNTLKRAAEAEAGNVKKLRKPIQEYVCPPKFDEPDEEWKRRCQRAYEKNYRSKNKQEQLQFDKDLEKALKAALEASDGDENDFFLKHVVGWSNYNIANPQERDKKCNRQITKHIEITQNLNRVNMKCKPDEQKLFPTGYYKVAFLCDLTKNIGTPAAKTTRKSKNQETKETKVDWLVIKQSNIKDAKLGCFADTDFNEGAIIGKYMAKKGTGQKKNRIRWNGETISCYSFSKKECFSRQSVSTMGMQMMNDPNLRLESDEDPRFEVNAEIKSDLFVQALKDIKKGEEIFIHYNYDPKDDDQDSDAEVNPGSAQVEQSSDQDMDSEEEDDEKQPAGLKDPANYD